MVFTNNDLTDFHRTRSLEWLETNGLGGYASGTAAGAHSRRYHGLLVAAVHPPVGRMVMVSKLEETIVTEDARAQLSSNQYPGVIHPKGYEYLTEFSRDLFPEFHYKVGDIEIKKTVAAIHGENTTIVLYEVVNAPDTFDFELLPLYACRDFHSTAHANSSIQSHYEFSDGVFRTTNYQNCPEVFMVVPGSSFTERKEWYYNYEYSVEHYRGLDATEDLYTHGKFSIPLKKGSQLGVIISIENPSGKDAFQLFQQEKARREKVVSDFSWNQDIKRLVLAADQFIVKRKGLKTIIAGYHWFSDWGRDTMISLCGLCLVTGRFDDARNILKEFAESVSEGMLPNRFPDYGESPEYNTIDASLWFFQAIHKYYKYTKDIDFVKSVIPVLRDMIDWHYKGTRFNIHVDPADELLYGGADGVQLTWMDAKVGDWVVTPRKGKAVEINALWYNALSIIRLLLEETGQPEESGYYRLKENKVLESFNLKFWNEAEGYLYDCIDGENNDNRIRPNQLYAISLPFPLLTKERASKVFETVEKNLFTPKGLRSLSPTHEEYKPVYGGNPLQRDSEYHQGTVWSFLLGAYIDALMLLKDGNAKPEATAILNAFFDHLNEACVGSVSEIFDAELPHTPRGCVAQAWGVAEVLRVAVEHNLLTSTKK